MKPDYKSALFKACEYAADQTGTCPHDQKDWLGCPAIDDDGASCHNQTTECWMNYFIQESTKPKKHPFPWIEPA